MSSLPWTGAPCAGRHAPNLTILQPWRADRCLSLWNPPNAVWQYPGLDENSRGNFVPELDKISLFMFMPMPLISASILALYKKGTKVVRVSISAFFF
jgi:hypothetical protein